MSAFVTAMTLPQTKVFWRMFSAACRELGIPDPERDAYRKRVMWDELKVRHMSQINRTKGFDRVMARLAVDAGDYEAAARYSSGDERSLFHLAERCAGQVMQLAERDGGAEYVTAVARQAGYAVTASGHEFWMDVAADQIAAVFKMLDTHRRRLLRKLGFTGSAAFDPGVSYSVIGEPGAIRVAVECSRTPRPAGACFRIVAA